MERRRKPGRPRTSAADRAEQLRQAKRRQRAARREPRFAAALGAFLDESVVDVRAWPALRELAWNRKDRWIPAQEALALYERNWRFVDERRLDPAEAKLIEQLKTRYGGGAIPERGVQRP